MQLLGLRVCERFRCLLKLWRHPREELLYILVVIKVRAAPFHQRTRTAREGATHA
jgi:hypothetical protein